MKAAVAYVCQRCGAACTQLWWAAIGVEKGEGRCPGCGAWAKFVAKAAQEKAA